MLLDWQHPIAVHDVCVGQSDYMLYQLYHRETTFLRWVDNHQYQASCDRDYEDEIEEYLFSCDHEQLIPMTEQRFQETVYPGKFFDTSNEQFCP